MRGACVSEFCSLPLPGSWQTRRFQTGAGRGDSAFPASQFSSCPQEVALAFTPQRAPWVRKLGPAEKVKACRGVVYHPSSTTTQSRCPKIRASSAVLHLSV